MLPCKEGTNERGGVAQIERRTAPPSADSDQAGSRRRGVAAVLAVAAVTLLLRLPGLLEPHHYSDEGIFAAVAQRLLQGHRLYAEAWEDKPPLIYWLYAAVLAVAGPSMAAIRAVAAVWAAAAAAGVTVIGVRLLGRRAGLACALVFAVLVSLPLIEANLALTELFAATPVIGAMLLLIQAERRPPAGRERIDRPAVAATSVGRPGSWFDRFRAVGSPSRRADDRPARPRRDLPAGEPPPRAAPCAAVYAATAPPVSALADAGGTPSAPGLSVTRREPANLARRPRGPHVPLIAGTLFGVAFMFKQVAAFDLAAAGLYLLLSGRDGVRRALLLGAGFALPLAVIGAGLALQGALGDALFAVFGFYAIYLREGSGLPPSFTVFKLAPLLLALAAALIAARRRAVAPADLMLLWLGCAVAGATLAARPYGHYLVQALAPLTLCLALASKAVRSQPPGAGVNRGAAPATSGQRGAEREATDGQSPGLLAPADSALLWRDGPAARRAVARRSRQRATIVRWFPAVVTLAALYVIGVAFSGFWWSYPAVRAGYYAAVAGRITGGQPSARVNEQFSWRVEHQRQFAAIIAGDQRRTLFVWGEYPWLYPLAGAENPTRYVTSYHTSFVPGAKAEVIETLRRTPPQYIVWERDEWRRLPGLAALLAERYDLAATAGSTELYRRRDH